MTLNIIDIICALYLLFYFVRGWYLGLLRSLSGPIALILASFLALFIYEQTQDLILGLIVGVLGPVILQIILALIFKAWYQATDQDRKAFTIGRVLGGTFYLSWSIIVLVLTLILIMIIPNQFPLVSKVQKLVEASATYKGVSHLLGDRMQQPTESLQHIQEVMQDPEAFQKIQDVPEYREVMDHPRVIELFSDEESLQQLREKDYRKLLSNPKLKALFEDKDLIKKFFILHKRISEEEIPAQS